MPEQEEYASGDTSLASPTSNERLRIGEILVDLEVITEERLAEALMIQRGDSRPLGRILVDLGYLIPIC